MGVARIALASNHSSSGCYGFVDGSCLKSANYLRLVGRLCGTIQGKNTLQCLVQVLVLAGF